MPVTKSRHAQTQVLLQPHGAQVVENVDQREHEEPRELRSREGHGRAQDAKHTQAEMKSLSHPRIAHDSSQRFLVAASARLSISSQAAQPAGILRDLDKKGNPQPAVQRYVGADGQPFQSGPRKKR